MLVGSGIIYWSIMISDDEQERGAFLSTEYDPARRWKLWSV